jgi:hypothetical protein
MVKTYKEKPLFNASPLKENERAMKERYHLDMHRKS